MPARGLMTAGDVHAWMLEYEQSDVIPRYVDLSEVAWTRCYASTSPRALKTARALFDQGAIVTKDELREPDIRQFGTGRLKLPYGGWRWLLRLAWLTGHPSQRQVKQDFHANIEAMIRTLRAHSGEPTLVVSHAGVMMFLQKALMARGFTGPKFRLPECGRLYVYQGEWK